MLVTLYNIQNLHLGFQSDIEPSNFATATIPLRKLAIANFSTKLARLNAVMEDIGGDTHIATLRLWRAKGIDAEMIHQITRGKGEKNCSDCRRSFDFPHYGSPALRHIFPLSGDQQGPVKMKDTEGYMMFHIGSAYRELRTEAERKEFLKQENLRVFLATTFQTEIPKLSRIISILRHKQWRDMVMSFCMTDYGEDSFAWYTMASIVTAKLDEASIYSILPEPFHVTKSRRKLIKSNMVLGSSPLSHALHM
jgi:hypothetical protein